MNLKDLKNIARAVFAAGILFSAGGCADEGFDAPDAPSDGMTIRFYSTNLKTRATEPSDALLNENLISNISIALYPSGAADDIPAVKFKSFEGISGNGEWETKMTLSDAEVERLFGSVTATGATCRIFAVANISDQNIASLGNAPTIANMKALPVTAQFETQQVQPDFVMTGEGTVQYNVDSNNNKTATGEVALDRTAAKITLNLKFGTRDDGNGNQVPVVDYGVVDAEGNTWKPLVGGAGNTGAMRVLLNNGVKNSEAVPGTDYVRSEEDYFNITTGAKDSYDFENTGSATYPYSQEIPFYTYPNKWANTPQERRRTAMTLLIPWGRVDKNNTNEFDAYSTFYYTVPVTASDMPELISNNIYQVNLSVGMLGSLEPEAPATLEATYQVVDWGNAPIDVDISETRYLVISPTSYTVNNAEEFNLSFYSSHPVEVEDITMTYQRFSFITQTGNNNMGAVVYFPTSKQIIDRSVTSDGIKMVEYSENITTAPNSKQYVFNLKHKLEVWTPLNNASATSITTGNLTTENSVRLQGNQVIQTGYTNLADTTNVQNAIQKYLRSQTPEAAYSPYVFTVTLRHKDNKEFKTSFTIVQYPAMYIRADKNPGGSYREGSSYLNVSTYNYGYVFVNPVYHPAGTTFLGRPYDAYWENSSAFGGVHGISSNADNKNPNMYVINLTSLSGNYGNYIIGDPRSLNIRNDLAGNPGKLPEAASTTEASWAEEADALYIENGSTNKRKLNWYYPTREGASTKTMLAPKIRVASSYGVCTTGTSTENLRKRCASYQEQGCPAGRWRVPTYSEVEFIVKLSSKGLIPLLFTKGGTYLTAQGFISVDNNDEGTITLLPNQTDGSVRAVYDEWYWEKETNYVLQHNSDGGYDFTWGDMPKRNPQN